MAKFRKPRISRDFGDEDYVRPPASTPPAGKVLAHDPSAGPAAAKPSARRPPVPSPPSTATAVLPAITAVRRDRPVVSLSPAPGAAKKGSAAARGANAGARFDLVMAAVADTNRKKFGSEHVWAGRDGENLIVGIPCPLPFEYLIGHDVYPLGLVTQVVGEPGTGKSSLAFEIVRWHKDAGGGGFIAEVESKISEDLMRSIVRLPMHGEQHVVLVGKAYSVEDWQEKLLFNLREQKARLPGKDVPVAFVVDSVSGKMSAETQQKIEEVGHYGRTHPNEARSIAGFMKTIPHHVADWPFSLVLVNHRKEGTDSMGNTTQRITGGSSLRFQESFEIHTGVRKAKIESAGDGTAANPGWEGKHYTLACRKNSLGSDRRIDVRMLWWEELNPATDEYEQVTRWQWGWALVHLLTAEDVMPARFKARLRQHGVHVEATLKSDVKNAAWSRNLGMKEADAVPWEELGNRIMADRPLADTVRKCLAIRRQPLLAGDYLKQREAKIEGLS